MGPPWIVVGTRVFIWALGGGLTSVNIFFAGLPSDLLILGDRLPF